MSGPQTSRLAPLAAVQHVYPAGAAPPDSSFPLTSALQHIATHCNTLQHTAIHCNTVTLQHTATRCKILQHTATDASGAARKTFVDAMSRHHFERKKVGIPAPLGNTQSVYNKNSNLKEIGVKSECETLFVL